MICSEFACKDVKKPIDGHILGPYVELEFAGGGSTIKVGNKSYPTKNTAIIKSFQYGQSDGVGAEVEIYDEEGGAFQSFVDKVARTPGESINLYKAKARWGWITKDCSGNTNLSINQPHYFAIFNVDVVFSGKGILFKLELHDLMEPLFETRVNKSYENLTLKEAIRTMFKQDANPPIKNIDFLRAKQSGGGTEPLVFSGNVEKNPATWHCNNQTPLAAAREWISNFRSERDNKGITVFYDNKTSEPRLIFLEDPMPKCFTNDPSCQNNIGTYIVNGGKESSVLSFEPKIKFNFSVAARAEAAVSSESAKVEIGRGQPCPPNRGGTTGQGQGSATMIQTPESSNRLYGPEEAAKESVTSQAGNQRANKVYENIEAELRIQGDPSLDDAIELRIKKVSIIVINPFHLVPSGDCPNWLAKPPCNAVLSNKNWFINGVSHDIRAGSYTTTLKVSLPVPGSSL